MLQTDTQEVTPKSVHKLETVAENKISKAGTQRQERVFFPNLDGLRFICFLVVFLFHSFATDYAEVKESGLYRVVKGVIAQNGNLGVNFFFVLSGFLITYLLIVEKNRFQNINIGQFYMRRILRIWPLFYFCVFFGFVVFPFIKILFGETPNETARLPYYLTFLNNFDRLHQGPADSSVLGVLWSVAVEEQFYLIWPILLAIVPARRYLYVFLSVIAVSLVFRITHTQQPKMLEKHTLSCIGDMAIGGLFAYFSYYNKAFVDWFHNQKKTTWIVLYVAVVAVYFFRRPLFWNSEILLVVDRFFIAILFAFVILEQNYAANSLFKMSNFKILSWLGTLTYGLYCLHKIGILVAAITLEKLNLNKSAYQVVFLEGGLSLLITIVMAWFSYRYFESWFLKYKNAFARIVK